MKTIYPNSAEITNFCKNGCFTVSSGPQTYHFLIVILFLSNATSTKIMTDKCFCVCKNIGLCVSNNVLHCIMGYEMGNES